MKHGDSFILADRRADLPGDELPPAGAGRHLRDTGFYVGGTRHLSRLELGVTGIRPVLLSSSLADDDATLEVAQSTTDHGVLFLRELTVVDGKLLQRVDVRSYRRETVTLEIELRFEADFADIFEVRGYPRAKRGELLAPRVEGAQVMLTYHGLDDLVRRTILRFSPLPFHVDSGVARFRFTLAPGEGATLEIAAAGGLAATLAEPEPDTRSGVAKVRTEHEAWDRTAARFFTASEHLNALFERASADLRLMCTRMPEGLVPYAGIPWYACPFGRDSLWTSWMTLTVQPDVAAGTLRYLARRQATGFDDFTDSEPGKILHEMRHGEMANLREIPFIPYYGTVDATPLFVALMERYVRWTGDRDLLEELWPHVRAALAWVRGPADLDGDGLIEYARRSPAGLSNQGWKDSSDSIFHRTGELAKGPIAIVEAQAYAFAALKAGASLAGMRGETQLAAELDAAARVLQKELEAKFWVESLGTYALALDGAKSPCEVVTSNAGHVLWAGMADEARAARVSRSLLSPGLFSGWGVRTVAEDQARYNPISYHNGSVWPHDNAIVAYGLKRYGHRDETARLASAILDASVLFDDNRVPELFCGFARSPRHAPTPYPVACRPQAWSAATIFALVEAMLGLEVDGAAGRVVFTRPSLPAWLPWIEITNLAAGSRRSAVRLERTETGGAAVARSSGDGKVQVIS